MHEGDEPGADVVEDLGREWPRRPLPPSLLTRRRHSKHKIRELQRFLNALFLDIFLPPTALLFMLADLLKKNPLHKYTFQLA